MFALNSGTKVQPVTARKRFRTVDLSEIVSRLVESYQAVADEKQQVLSIDAVHDVQVIGDDELLSQMLVNLIENAINHSGHGARIKVSLQSRHDETCLSVSDNGPGIPDGETTNVLKPFYRLEHSRTSQGNGLGLAVVNAIAKLHHAEIRFGNRRPGLEAGVMFQHAG